MQEIFRLVAFSTLSISMVFSAVAVGAYLGYHAPHRRLILVAGGVSLIPFKYMETKLIVGILILMSVIGLTTLINEGVKRILELKLGRKSIDAYSVWIHFPIGLIIYVISFNLVYALLVGYLVRWRIRNPERLKGEKYNVLCVAASVYMLSIYRLGYLSIVAELAEFSLALVLIGVTRALVWIGVTEVIRNSFNKLRESDKYIRYRAHDSAIKVLSATLTLGFLGGLLKLV